MPLRYRCRNCNNILYEYRPNSYGIPTPTKVVRAYRRVCPFCGSELGMSWSVRVESKARA